MADDYPQIVDLSTLTGVFQAGQFMAIGVEGEKDAEGTATVALPELVRNAEEANTLFGAGSPLALLVKFILARGISYVWAVCSASAIPPTLVERQTAWVALEENEDIRIRLTDSTTQADLVALAESCEWAEGIQHKQFCFVALGGASVKAVALAAATAISSKRAVLMSPHVYDNEGVLLDGAFDAALAACEVAKNPDIVDSLNGAVVPATSGIEVQASTGLPIYRLRAGAGTPVNDHQDLLDGGVSTYQQDRSGQAALTHLRMAYTTDDTFDALTTLLIKDEVFLGLRTMLKDQKFLRMPNNANNRSLAAKLVDQWLKAHSDWVEPVGLPDGTDGYGVSVVEAEDHKSFTVAYQGQVVRGTNVININGTLTIPV